MVSAASHEVATSRQQSDSEEGSQTSETMPSNLANNPYALVGDGQVGHVWGTLELTAAFLAGLETLGDSAVSLPLDPTGGAFL
jgi:hypothetical protein